MADCTCAYIETNGPTGRRCVWRDPICAVHYERPRFYGPDGNEVPVGEKFPPEMKVG